MILTHFLLAALPQVAAPAPTAAVQPPAQDPVVAAPAGQGGHGGTTRDNPLFPTDIWFYFPTEGFLLTPVLIVGPNLGENPTARFGSSSSSSLLNINSPELPIIGTIGLTVPLVPIYIFGGTVDLSVSGACGISPGYPFKLL